MGRTARAGQAGVVTSLYTRSNRDLVKAVRHAEDTNQPVVIWILFLVLYYTVFFVSKVSKILTPLLLSQENAFSRKRSFRKKLKKRGTFFGIVHGYCIMS